MTGRLRVDEPCGSYAPPSSAFWRARSTRCSRCGLLLEEHRLERSDDLPNLPSRRTTATRPVDAHEPRRASEGPMFLNLLPAAGVAIDFGDMNKDGTVELVITARMNGADVAPARFVVPITAELAKNLRDTLSSTVSSVLAGRRS